VTEANCGTGSGDADILDKHLRDSAHLKASIYRVLVVRNPGGIRMPVRSVLVVDDNSSSQFMGLREHYAAFFG
jgi:hypothetical protein